MSKTGENPVEALARELWEAHALHHEALTRLPAEPWEALAPWMQDHWRMLARVALAFATGSDLWPAGHTANPT